MAKLTFFVDILASFQPAVTLTVPSIYYSVSESRKEADDTNLSTGCNLFFLLIRQAICCISRLFFTWIRQAGASWHTAAPTTVTARQYQPLNTTDVPDLNF